MFFNKKSDNSNKRDRFESNFDKEKGLLTPHSKTNNNNNNNVTRKSSVGFDNDEQSVANDDKGFPGLIPEFSWTLMTLIALTGLSVLLIWVLSSYIQDWLGKHYTFGNQLLLFSIPFISTIFTFFHIWLALWMTFYPLEFVGVYQLTWSKVWGNVGLPGWQGIGN